MIPKSQDVISHAFGIVDDDARLRFLSNTAADAAKLAYDLSALSNLAVDDKINKNEQG